MNQQALYWIDGQWKSLEVDNAENLDNLDSTDFALNGHRHFKSEITDLPVVATTTQDGFMSAQDKSKLNTIAVNANHYVHPNDANTRHVTDAEKTTWNNKANANHTHLMSQVSGLEAKIAELDSKITSGSSNGFCVPSKTVLQHRFVENYNINYDISDIYEEYKHFLYQKKYLMQMQKTGRVRIVMKTNMTNLDMSLSGKSNTGDMKFGPLIYLVKNAVTETIDDFFNFNQTLYYEGDQGELILRNDRANEDVAHNYSNNDVKEFGDTYFETEKIIKLDAGDTLFFFPRLIIYAGAYVHFARCHYVFNSTTTIELYYE